MGAAQNATTETLRKYWKHVRYKRSSVTNCQRLHHKVCPVPQGGRIAANEKGDTMFRINNALSRRSFLTGAAALGSAVALAGCSSGGTDGGSADDGKTFKIGVIGPLTGAAATYGVSAEKGAKLAAKDFSTKDLKLSLKSEDDVADGEKAINAFNTLCDWGMQALVGPVTTGAAVAVSGEIADDMLMVTPSASSLDVTKDKTTVFQVCFTDPTMGASAAKFLAEKYADAKIALFYNSGDTYSSGVADAFAEQAKASKLDVVDTETFKDDSSTSFTNQLTKAKEAGATLIFAPIYYTPASVLLKNAKGMGYDMTLMGTDGMDGLLSVEGFDTSLAEGVLLMTPFSDDDEKNADFGDLGRQVHRRLGAHKTRPVRLF